MLEAFKKSGKNGRNQAEELEALIATCREERAAVSTMLTQMQLQSTKLATAGKSLQEVDEKAGHAHALLDEVMERLAKAVDLPLLGQVPLYPRVMEGGETGAPIVTADASSSAARALIAIATRIASLAGAARAG